METLRLFNVGWECIGKKPPADHYFTTQYHQIGNMRVFTYSAYEAYDHVLVELARRHERTKNTIKITIPFVEEIKPEEGLTNEREMQWSDANKYGDWLRDQRKGNDNQFTDYECDIPECQMIKFQNGKEME